MEKQFHLDIITEQEVIYSGEAVSVIVPAQLGYLGVLADHAPLAAKIFPGRVAIREGSGNIRRFDIEAKGVMEVFSNNVTLLLDNA
jgi:F-type H+-transporting ATPase subunit epsilon